jgi:hypothetical protein
MPALPLTTCLADTRTDPRICPAEYGRAAIGRAAYGRAAYGRAAFCRAAFGRAENGLPAMLRSVELRAARRWPAEAGRVPGVRLVGTPAAAERRFRLP